MSYTEANAPICTSCVSTPAIETIIEARHRVGGFTVRRLLPSSVRRLVGPFIFFDHMGPAALAPGQGIDVRPHPHINLATVTYLFDGEIVHRDSLGSHQPIRPGAINWMTAGRGIVHSERTGPELRKTGSRLHGIQLWVALPKGHEEAEPEFRHYGAPTLPALEAPGVRMRILIGTAYGATSPVQTLSSLFYVEATMSEGGELALPGEHEGRAAYVAEGAVWCGPERIEVSRMIVFVPGSMPRLQAESPARVMLLGGAPMDGERHLWWNFVSSSKARIERAKRDWKEGRFPKVPGETEFIPLPETE
ncbi:MAG: pirin family protein [Beggiatoa sp.]|nr:pirin family protein [Beggiatoa sp.]